MEQATKTVAWQGFTLTVPEAWDLTGFSGEETEGYLRVDDSEARGVEIKWGTESEKAKHEPDPEARRESYFLTLEKAAARKKLPLTTREVEPPRSALRPERAIAGFQWTGDRRASGVVWYCRTCRRVVIAQVLGNTSGKGLSATAEAVLGAIRCHSDDPEWRVWALYDLYTEIPTSFTLLSQQLMNVYLRLTFGHRQSKAARLSVEQWSVANVARKSEYLDTWLALNSKAELAQARYEAEIREHWDDLRGHDGLLLNGAPAIGLPWIEVAKQVIRIQRPAVKFSATAWECQPSNKVYLVQTLRPGRVPDPVPGVATRTRCHEGPLSSG